MYFLFCPARNAAAETSVRHVDVGLLGSNAAWTQVDSNVSEEHTAVVFNPEYKYPPTYVIVK
jgi:hypothetical protein